MSIGWWRWCRVGSSSARVGPHWEKDRRSRSCVTKNCNTSGAQRELTFVRPRTGARCARITHQVQAWPLRPADLTFKTKPMYARSGQRISNKERGSIDSPRCLRTLIAKLRCSETWPCSSTRSGEISEAGKRRIIGCVPVLQIAPACIRHALGWGTLSDGVG
jgi:hypothetical protein